MFPHVPPPPPAVISPHVNFDAFSPGQFILTPRQNFGVGGCEFPKGALIVPKGLKLYPHYEILAFTLKTSTVGVHCPFGTFLRIPASFLTLHKISRERELEQVPPWAALHLGISQNYAGQSFTLPTTNATVIKFQNMEFVRGKASWFGTAEDTGVTPHETGALIPRTRLRSLSKEFLGVAFRMDYSQASPKVWAKQRILMVNADTGKAVVAPIIDWGPARWTGRAIDVTPGVATGLGYRHPDDITDRHVNFAFAPPDLEPGVYDLNPRTVPAPWDLPHPLHLDLRDHVAGAQAREGLLDAD